VAAVVGAINLSGMLLMAAGPSSPITISNFSFETPSLSVGGSSDLIPSWNEENHGYGTSLIGVYRPSLANHPGGIPDGTNVAYIESPLGTIWQGTSKTIEGSDLSYSLSAFVGRADLYNGTTQDQAQTTIELRAGDSYTNSALLTSLIIPRNTVNPGAFSNFTLTLDQTTPNFSSLISANLGKNVIVAFSIESAFKESDIDLVQLSYVPEPGSVALIGCGVALLLVRPRRSR
jgi:hypothetical protein